MGRWPKSFSTWVGCGTVFLALVVAIGCIGWVVQHPADTFVKEFTWVDAGDVLTTDGFLGAVGSTPVTRVDVSVVTLLEVVPFSIAAIVQLAVASAGVSFIRVSVVALLTVVDQAIADLGATDPKMTGQVIGAVMRSGEDVDGALVARLVNEALADR